MRSRNLIAFVLLLSGCAKPVEVVLPDGYVGSKWISLVTPDAEDAKIRDGGYVVDFTTSHGDFVQTPEAFDRLKHATFRYSDGTPIPREEQLSKRDENAVAVRGATYCKAPTAAGGRRKFLFYIGTKEQYRLSKPWSLGF